jgi:alpha-beta hydrolase superfamily lysophospholipase
MCNAGGIGFFRFDHRGCGASEGRFESCTTLKARCSDLIQAVKTIRARKDTGSRIGLFGSSLGGAVCLAVFDALKAQALVTFAAPARSSFNMQTQALNIENDSGQATDWLLKEQLHFDISERLTGIRNVMIFHGEADDVVPLSHAREIYAKALRPKKLIVQANGDHRMSNKAHQTAFSRQAADWFKTYLK